MAAIRVSQFFLFKKTRFGIRISSDGRKRVSRQTHKNNSVKYVLRGIISNINDRRHSENFLISQVNGLDININSEISQSTESRP